MSRIIVILCIACTYYSSVFAQLPKTHHLNSGINSSLPLTNSINDIFVRHDSIWFGTGHGLSLTVDDGRIWINFANTVPFDDKGISAIAINDYVIWVAIGYSSKIGDESVQTGGGLYYSTNKGVTWVYITQPVDKGTVDTLWYGNNRIRAMNITVPQQNITFDIALTRNIVWTASWAGMLRKSTDNGVTWSRVILPPDNRDSIKLTDSLDFAFDLAPTSGNLGLEGNDNHKLFSVIASDDTTIWAGTAGGINKSTDGGISWRKFSHQNQAYPISGNFVVALKEQIWGGRKFIWAATVNANDPSETKGVSYSENGGETWKTTLLSEWAHNFAVKDSIVYVATDNGLFRSSDFGESWARNGTIYDHTNHQQFVSTECYGTGAKGDTIWYGGPEGLAYTIDSPFQPFGSLWRIFRTYEPLGNEKKTYAYPNPFSPNIEAIRLHYSLSTDRSGTREVSIRIFDFAMHPVRTLIQKALRPNGLEYDEIWDGTNDLHSIVTNGVYFYRLEINDQSPVWGKILVLR